MALLFLTENRVNMLEINLISIGWITVERWYGVEKPVTPNIPRLKKKNYMCQLIKHAFHEKKMKGYSTIGYDRKGLFLEVKITSLLMTKNSVL